MPWLQVRVLHFFFYFDFCIAPLLKFWAWNWEIEHFKELVWKGVKFAVFSFESCWVLLHVGPEPQLLGVGLCFLNVGWLVCYNCFSFGESPGGVLFHV